MDKVDTLFEKIAIVRYPFGASFPMKTNPFKGVKATSSPKGSPGIGERMMETVKGVGSSIYDRVGEPAAIFGAGLIVSQFAEELIKKIKERRLESKSPEFFQKMLEKHPVLLEYDPDEIAMLWETLWSAAPHAAQDHVMAGAFIKQNLDKEVMKEHEGPPLDTYKMLSDIEKSRSGSSPSGKPAYLDIFMNMLKEEKK